jgi:hypothetical protein
MVATTISIAPRAFIATAIDAASQNRRPAPVGAQRAADQLAQARDGDDDAQHPPVAQLPQVHAQADDAEEDWREHAEGERFQARDRLLAQARRLVQTTPVTNAPNTG